jgi:hypothetical protein
MPGCRKGDMAVIFIDEPAPFGRNDVGRFVDVHEPTIGINGTACWRCTAVDGNRMWVRFGGVFPILSKVAIIPDDWLKPIRGLPLQDKTETHRPAALGAPREEPVCAEANKREETPA